MYFCLSCTTTKEEETRIRVTSVLQSALSDEFYVWFPKKQVSERRKGVFETLDKPLFAGYLFIFWEGEDEEQFPFIELRRLPSVNRILSYDDGSHNLKGSDMSFAKWIHMHNGYIKQSKVVYRPGQRVHICEGPLCGFDGNVIKVDKHHKRIVLRFEIGGTVSDVNFSVEFLEASSQSNALSSGTFQPSSL